MKRILIFSVAYHPFIGGAEVAVKEITDRLGHSMSDQTLNVRVIEFDMITLNLDGRQPARERIGNVNVYRIGGPGRLYKLLFTVRAWRFAVKLHRKHVYDATWSIMASFNSFAALFFSYSYPKVPFILTLQEGDPIPYIKRQVWFVYPLFKQIFKRANLIQTISNFLKDFARDMGATCPVTVIPNGVDLAVFSKPVAPADLARAVQVIGKKEGDTILITTSRLVEKNGIADVIKALPLLPARVKFVILGIGPLEVPLKKLVSDLNLKERIIFIGHVEYKNIPAYLAASDIFIRPSLSEGMGNSFIEAMAVGIPVIATPVGGIPDFLTDGETGIFCNPRDPKSIAEKVTLLMNNSDLRAHITTTAKSLATQNYDWSLIASRMSSAIFSKL